MCVCACVCVCVCVILLETMFEHQGSEPSLNNAIHEVMIIFAASLITVAQLFHVWLELLVCLMFKFCVAFFLFVLINIVQTTSKSKINSLSMRNVI